MQIFFANSFPTTHVCGLWQYKQSRPFLICKLCCPTCISFLWHSLMHREESGLISWCGLWHWWQSRLDIGPFCGIFKWHLIHLSFGTIVGAFSENEWHLRHENASIPIPCTPLSLWQFWHASLWGWKSWTVPLWHILHSIPCINTCNACP